jgi:hypothetical protein
MDLDPGVSAVLLDVVVHTVDLIDHSPRARLLVVAVQFLDYPLLTISPCQAGGTGPGRGKSCSFTADVEQTRAMLRQVRGARRH